MWEITFEVFTIEITVTTNVNCVAKTVLPNKVFSFTSPECISPTNSFCLQIQNIPFCNLHLHLHTTSSSGLLASNDPNELFKYVTRSSEDQRYCCTLCPHFSHASRTNTRIMSRQNICHKSFITNVTRVTPVLIPRVHGPCIGPKSIVKRSFPIIHRFWNRVFFMPKWRSWIPRRSNSYAYVNGARWAKRAGVEVYGLWKEVQVERWLGLPCGDVSYWPSGVGMWNLWKVAENMEILRIHINIVHKNASLKYNYWIIFVDLIHYISS